MKYWNNFFSLPSSHLLSPPFSLLTSLSYPSLPHFLLSLLFPYPLLSSSSSPFTSYHLSLVYQVYLMLLVISQVIPNLNQLISDGTMIINLCILNLTILMLRSVLIMELHLMRYLYMYVCMYVHLCMYVYMYVYIYVCTCICMYICMYVCIYICVLCMYVCICMYMYVHVCMYV